MEVHHVQKNLDESSKHIIIYNKRVMLKSCNKLQLMTNDNHWLIRVKNNASCSVAIATERITENDTMDTLYI